MENSTLNQNAYNKVTETTSKLSNFILTPQLVSENTTSTEYFNIRLKPTQFLKFDYDTDQPFFEIPLLSALKHNNVRNLSFKIICPSDFKYSHVTYSFDNLWKGSSSTIFLNYSDNLKTNCDRNLPNYDFILLSSMLSPSFSLRIHNIWEFLPILDMCSILLMGDYITFSDTLKTSLSEHGTEQVVCHNERFNICRHMCGLTGMAYSSFMSSEEFFARKNNF